MARPAKSIDMIIAEGRNHITKAEIELRRKEEQALLTGQAIKEWPATRMSPSAHKHFMRVRSLLGKIGKNDALNEPVINRYCIMLIEAEDMEEDMRSLSTQLTVVEAMHERREMGDREYLRKKADLLNQKVTLDRTLSSKRKMLLDIEKENIMTIASGLRSVTKRPKEEEQEDRMSDMLDRRMRLVQP